MVIFGAGGDLTKRLVMPALYNLAHSKVLPENFALIGIGHAAGTSEQWRDSLYAMLKTFVGNTASNSTSTASTRRHGRGWRKG
jgi:glucose-6-phosphate 1-dehydrogenase